MNYLQHLLSRHQGKHLLQGCGENISINSAILSGKLQTLEGCLLLKFQPLAEQLSEGCITHRLALLR